MKKKALQAKHLEDTAVLRAVDEVSWKSWPDGTPLRPGDCRWALMRDLEPLFAEFPVKVLRAKLSSMIRRKLLTGCTCGCRGDFALTNSGLRELRNESLFGPSR